MQIVLFFFEKENPLRSVSRKMEMIQKWIHIATLCRKDKHLRKSLDPKT
jgi:hypothetical protein